jgi:DNA adenine methylase
MNDIVNLNDYAPKPFLRWAGGKRWLIKHIEKINELNIETYYEPFLGGGSVFFNTSNYKDAYLSDLNPDLVDSYLAIRDNCDSLIEKLSRFGNSESEYYRVREAIFVDKIDKAAQFIFLNKTSFNGIYRVNKNGKFNVPYGFRKNVDVVDGNNLKKVSLNLQNTTIASHDFEGIAGFIKKGDFVFLDPPYTVAHENNGFIQYNQKLFSVEDQIRLSEFIEVIEEREAYYIMTNAKHNSILEIYSKIATPHILKRKSLVGGVGARREGFNEYIFSNFL